MASFSINQAVQKPRGTRIAVPVIQPSLGFERSYVTAMNGLIQGCANAYRDILLPAYQQRQLTVADRLTMDVDEATFGGFSALVRALARGVIDRVRELLRLEARRHTKQWLSAAKKAFGIDLAGVVQEENLTSYLEAAALRNASLINGMTDDLIKRVQQDVLNALIAGESAAQLKPRVQKSLNISGSRARLIARDQTSKLTADLTKQRHKEAGINSYIWRTSHDERVRPLHKKLDGRKYQYDEPTDAEDGLPPGQPIQCRCVAQAVVEW